MPLERQDTGGRNSSNNWVIIIVSEFMIVTWVQVMKCVCVRNLQETCFMELYVTQRAVWRGTERESRQRPQGYWVRHAQEGDVCLVVSTDRGGCPWHFTGPLRLGSPCPYTLLTHAKPTQYWQAGTTNRMRGCFEGKRVSLPSRWGGRCGTGGRKGVL